MLAAMGVDGQGSNHVLALKEGATENAEAVKDLLEQLVPKEWTRGGAGCS